MKLTRPRRLKLKFASLALASHPECYQNRKGTRIPRMGVNSLQGLLHISGRRNEKADCLYRFRLISKKLPIVFVVSVVNNVLPLPSDFLYLEKDYCPATLPVT